MRWACAALAVPARAKFERALAAALCLVAYMAPYFFMSGWWRFIPSTIVILATGAVALGHDSIRFFGLRLSARGSATTVALFVVALAASHYVLVDYVGTYLDIVRTATLRSYVHQFFQVLNDEIVMRAALLTALLKLGQRPTTVIPLAAVAFTFAHLIFYSSATMEVPTLLALFAFGVIGNTLFVAFGHIGYGLALHYAWNFYRFNTRYYVDGRGLWEGESFNYIEGNRWVVVGSVLLMVLVYGAYLRWAPQSSFAADASRARRR